MAKIDRQEALKRLLDYIGGLESGTKDESGYDSHLGNVGGKGMEKPLSQMTVKEVKEWQKSNGNKAVGRYQFIPDTLEEMLKKAGVSDDATFDSETQDLIAGELLKSKGFDKAYDGEMDPSTFRNKVATQWAGVSTTEGKSHYQGDKYGNKSVDDPEETSNMMESLFTNDNYKNDTTPSDRQQQKNTNPQAPGNNTEELTDEDWDNAPEGESTNEEGWYDEEEQEDDSRRNDQEADPSNKEEQPAPNRNEEIEMLIKQNKDLQNKLDNLTEQVAEGSNTEEEMDGMGSSKYITSEDVEKGEAEMEAEYANHPTLNSYKYRQLVRASQQRTKYKEGAAGSEKAENIPKASFGMVMQGGLGALGSLTDIYADSHGNIDGDDTYGNLKMASTAMKAGSDLAGNLDQWHKDKPQRIQEEADRLNAKAEQKAIDPATGKTKYQMDVQQARLNRQEARERLRNSRTR